MESASSASSPLGLTLCRRERNVYRRKVCSGGKANPRSSESGAFADGSRAVVETEFVPVNASQIRTALAEELSSRSRNLIAGDGRTVATEGAWDNPSEDKEPEERNWVNR